MNGTEKTELVNDARIYSSTKNELEGLKDRFSDLYVLYSLRNNLKIAIDIASQYN